MQDVMMDGKLCLVADINTLHRHGNESKYNIPLHTYSITIKTRYGWKMQDMLLLSLFCPSLWLRYYMNFQNYSS